MAVICRQEAGFCHQECITPKPQTPFNFFKSLRDEILFLKHSYDFWHPQSKGFFFLCMYFRIEMLFPWPSPVCRGSSLMGHKEKACWWFETSEWLFLLCPLFPFKMKTVARLSNWPALTSSVQIGPFAHLWGRNMGGGWCLSASGWRAFYNIWKKSVCPAFSTALPLPSAAISFLLLQWLLIAWWCLSPVVL